MYSRDDVLSNSDCKFSDARTPILLDQPFCRGIYRILMQIWRGKETWGRRRWRRRICQHCLIANQKPYILLGFWQSGYQRIQIKTRFQDRVTSSWWVKFVLSGTWSLMGYLITWSQNQDHEIFIIIKISNHDGWDVDEIVTNWWPPKKSWDTLSL